MRAFPDVAVLIPAARGVPHKIKSSAGRSGIYCYGALLENWALKSPSMLICL